MKKHILIRLIAILVLGVCLFSGCGGLREADKVNYNLSRDADYFNVERKITVYNARTDLVIFEAEGYLALSNNSSSELVVTFKVGPNQYKKNYVYLNAYTMYVVEDISGTHTDPYHYKWDFHTHILPDISIVP